MRWVSRVTHFGMRAAAEFPGMNSMPVFHDNWMADISASIGFVLAATIALALHGNYMTLGFTSYKYYARGLQDE